MIKTIDASGNAIIRGQPFDRKPHFTSHPLRESLLQRIRAADDALLYHLHEAVEFFHSHSQVDASGVDASGI